MSFNWWSHLVFMFAGMAGGVIIGVWVDKDTIFKGSVKIKNKNSPIKANTTSNTTGRRRKLRNK